MTVMPGKFERAGPAPRAKKLAEAVAEAIARDVIAMGWPVGRGVGSMQDLLVRYGVSHAVLREAVRQIEQNGLAVMRRGAGGGLVIAQRPEDVAAQTLATYLQLIDVDARELIAARCLAEDVMIRAASQRVTAAEAERLRALVGSLAGTLPEIELIIRYNRFMGALAEVAGNPLVSVMIKTAFRALTPALAPADRDTVGPRAEFVRRWAEVTETIIAGDSAAGIEILRATRPQMARNSILRAELRRRQAQAGAATLIATEILEAVDEGRGRKHSQLVALSIARNIAANGWPECHHLGLEPALLAEYQVSRNIFREAARILEVHGVCSAKRGQRGGFIVGRPRPDYAVETAVTSLRYVGVQPQQVGEMRLALQPKMTGLAAEAADGRGAEALKAALADGPEADAAPRFQQALGPAAGNRVMALMNAVVLGVEAEAEAELPSAGEAGARKAHEALAAVVAQDAPLARRITLDLCRLDYPDL
jgi:DNA-binding FadR family transcriptional regulator